VIIWPEGRRHSVGERRVPGVGRCCCSSSSSVSSSSEISEISDSESEVESDDDSGCFL
jgi:hypothetical protein